MKDVESYYVLSPGSVDDVATLAASMEASNGDAVVVGVGRSMEPAILSGDRVLLRKTTHPPRLGWIVVFPWKNRILTHRVVRVSDNVFWARGDACVEVEGPVNTSEIIGRLVGYWRDGHWCSLEGYKGRVAGLFFNVAMSQVRLAAKRWPRLRRLVETDLLGLEIVRNGFSRIGEWFFGQIVVAEEKSPERIIGVVVSEALPLTQHLVGEIEESVEKGDLRLFVAHTSRRRWVGNVLLSRVRLKEGVPTGYVFNLLVSLGFRGMGVGRRLLSAVEDAASRQGLKRLAALVESDNVRSLKAFLAAGYLSVPKEELAQRSAEERASVPEDRSLLEKSLPEV